jgi:hypothetical protein
MSASDYAARSAAVARVCARLGERAVDDARAWLALELSVYVATPGQRTRARGQLVGALSLGAATHILTTREQAHSLAIDLQRALGDEICDITTHTLVEGLARHLSTDDIHTILSRLPRPMPSWRAERVGH